MKRLGTQAAWKLINELTPDGDLSYLSDSTVGDISTFTFPAVTGSSCTAVVLFASVRKDDAGTRSIRGYQKNGSSVGDSGSDVPLTASYPTFPLRLLMETDPSTSAAWTIAGVNAEQGIKTSQ